MAVKKLNAQEALGNAPQGPPPTSEINYQEFVDSLPEEFRAEIEDAMVAMLSYIHSDEGTSQVLENVQNAKGNEAAQVGISALQAMDAADPDHQWSDSAKVFAGFFAVKEVSNIAREAGIIDIPEDEEGVIFQQAAQNYLHALIKDKPTQEERDAEAIRIQKEVEPLMTPKMREAAHSVAKERGIPVEDGGQGAQQQPAGQQQKKGGLLE